MAADVAFTHDGCINTCIVKPIYSDAASRTPFFMNDDADLTGFAPSYPPSAW